MNKTLKYKGLYGSIEYDFEDLIFHGKLLNISELVMYEGKSLEDLETNFKLMADYFLNEDEPEE